jgi:hypothetical protein
MPQMLALIPTLKVRDNNEILVYWEAEGKRGLFMVVEPIKLTAGQIKTLFSPEEGKRYFDFQEPVGRVLH